MKRWLTTLLTILALQLAMLAQSTPAYAVYLLDYGDGINVLVKDFPQYSYSGTVRPDGQISIPFVGEIAVAGMTTDQVASRITVLMRHIVREPIVAVTLTILRPRFMMVLGSVKTPGRVELNRPHMTVLDAIGAAGGFTEFAVRNRVILFHGDGADAQHYEVDVDKMLKTADLTDNLEVQPGDRISVVEGWRPTLQDVINVMTPIVSLISGIALLIAFYNQFAASSSKQQ